MFNIKYKNLFTKHKEQKYLKKLIQKIENKNFIQMYKEFETISEYNELENFIKKYNLKTKLNTNESIDELKEKVAFDIIELIYSNLNPKK